MQVSKQLCAETLQISLTFPVHSMFLQSFFNGQADISSSYLPQVGQRLEQLLSGGDASFSECMVLQAHFPAAPGTHKPGRVNFTS